MRSFTTEPYGYPIVKVTATASSAQPGMGPEKTVDGSGQARKVPLARFPLKATIVRTAAPRVDGSAFLTAKAVNETGFPLLSGAAGVYVGDEFAGRATLPATPAGGELELAFGADPRVTWLDVTDLSAAQTVDAARELLESHA